MIAAPTILDDRLGVIAPVVIFLSAETTDTLPCKLTHGYTSLSPHARTQAHVGSVLAGAPIAVCVRNGCHRYWWRCVAVVPLTSAAMLDKIDYPLHSRHTPA